MDGEYRAEVLESLPSGEYLIRFTLPKDEDAPSLAQRIGSLPLPPYVRRPAGHADEERYQTVYAKDKNRTAVAAPTAGLHFTPELIDQLLADGHNIHDLTLSVGLGTFRPIETDRVEDHPMHAEEYFLSPATKSVLRDKSAKNWRSVRPVSVPLSTILADKTAPRTCPPVRRHNYSFAHPTSF